MTARTRSKPPRRPKGSAVPEGPMPAFDPGASLPMGSNGRRHPPLGLGLWALGRWTRDDEAHTIATLQHALGRGFRWFDTAEVYGTGRSERMLGDTLAKAGPLDPPPFVTTKLSWEHLRPSQVRPSLLASLQRLGRSSVDLYLVHAPDPRVPIRDTMGALEALWKEGRIANIGVSNFSAEELEAAQGALSETEIVVNQVLVNLFDRADGDDVIDFCRRNRIVVEGYTPLARGLLTGRYLDGSAPSKEVGRFAHHLFEGDRFHEAVRRARELKVLAEEEGVPMASLALHWLARAGIAPVVGASRPAQVDDLIEAWGRRPTDSALDRADAITRGALD